MYVYIPLSSSLLSLQQLRSNMREMEKLCQRVRSAEAPALEKLVQPIRERASAATQDFLRLHSDSVSHPGPHPQHTDSAVSDSAHSKGVTCVMGLEMSSVPFITIECLIFFRWRGCGWGRFTCQSNPRLFTCHTSWAERCRVLGLVRRGAVYAHTYCGKCSNICVFV